MQTKPAKPTKTTLSIRELPDRRLRSKLESAVEEYLSLGDMIASLQREQKDLRKDKILPLTSQLNIAVGTKLTGESLREIEDEETGQTLERETEWSLSHDPGSKRLKESLLRKKLLALDIDPRIVDTCKKPGKSSIRISWSRKGEGRSSEEEDNGDGEE